MFYHPPSLSLSYLIAFAHPHTRPDAARHQRNLQPIGRMRFGARQQQQAGRPAGLEAQHQLLGLRARPLRTAQPDRHVLRPIERQRRRLPAARRARVQRGGAIAQRPIPALVADAVVLARRRGAAALVRLHVARWLHGAGVLLPRERRNVHRFAAERQLAQTADEALAQRGRPDGRRQRGAAAVQFAGAAQIDGAVESQVRRLARRPEVDGHTVDGDFALASVAAHGQVVPDAVVDATPGAAHFGRTGAEINVNVDVPVEQFDGEQVGLRCRGAAE